ncbi:hypothetical protein ACFE04_003537 [Oxalis oulophora]
METYGILPLSQTSFFPTRHHGNKAYPRPSWPCKKHRALPSTRVYCHKMFVPGFGEASPEAKAAKNLHNFFTFIAVKIVRAQLERPSCVLSVLSMAEQSYNPEAYKDLMEFLENHSLEDGDKFCASLMRESPGHKTLALRIMEVRSAYCKQDFEWDNLNRLATTMVEESNTKLMREYITETSSMKADK